MTRSCHESTPSTATGGRAQSCGCHPVVRVKRSAETTLPVTADVVDATRQHQPERSYVNCIGGDLRCYPARKTALSSVLRPVLAGTAGATTGHASEWSSGAVLVRRRRSTARTCRRRGPRCEARQPGIYCVLNECNRALSRVRSAALSEMRFTHPEIAIYTPRWGAIPQFRLSPRATYSRAPRTIRRVTYTY